MSAPIRVHEAFGLNSQEQQLLWWDDFLGDVLDDRWTSSGDAGGSAAVIDAETGGIVRFTTDGDDDDEWFLFWNNVRSLHVDQKVCVEFRVKLASVALSACFLQLRFTTQNMILFAFDTDVDGNWHTRTINGGATTDTDAGEVADTDYHIFRIESSSTSVSFFIDDVLVATHTTNIPSDAGDFLQPWLTLQTKEIAVKTMDVDYLVVRQERG